MKLIKTPTACRNSSLPPMHIILEQKASAGRPDKGELWPCTHLPRIVRLPNSRRQVLMHGHQRHRSWPRAPDIRRFRLRISDNSRLANGCMQLPPSPGPFTSPGWCGEVSNPVPETIDAFWYKVAFILGLGINRWCGMLPPCNRYWSIPCGTGLLSSVIIAWMGK